MEFQDLLASYEKTIIERISDHRKIALKNKKCDRILSHNAIFISATTALTMTLLTVLEVSQINVGIIGAVYAFIATINSKIKDQGYLEKYLNEIKIIEEYTAILIEVKHLLLTDPQLRDFDRINKLIDKYESIMKKDI